MKKLLIPGLLLSAMILPSCEDKIYPDDFGGEPLEPGSEIPFGVGLEPGQSQSRTVYGTEDPDNRVFPVYWKYSSDENELDRIIIQCPQAASDKKAVYKVKPANDTYTEPSAVINDDKDSEGLVLGYGNNSHSFYGFYPMGQVIDTDIVENSQETDSQEKYNYIYGEMPSVQRVDFPAAPSAAGVYEGKDNMEYCFMTAVRHSVVPLRGQPVQLLFRPWSTVIDISIPGPTADESFTVTNVVIRSLTASANASEASAPKITGTFKYTFPPTESKEDKGAIEFQTLSGSTGLDSRHEPSNLLTLQVYNSGGTQGVVLRKGQTLRLKGFMLPVTDVTGLRVEVYASGNKVWSATLRTPDGRNNLLTPGSIHNVGLPNIVSPGNDDYSSWMAELPNNVPVTQLSIPGSYDSFAYRAEGVIWNDQQNKKLQDINITSQFNAGIRAFRARVKVINTSDPAIPSITGQHLGITIENGVESIMSLGEAIHALHQEMQSRSDKEFCVLMLQHADQQAEVNLNTAGVRTNRDYYKLLKEYSTYMAERGITKRVDQVDWKNPDQPVTLGDVRGTVLLTGLLSARVPNGMSLFYATANSPIGPMHNIQRFLYSDKQHSSQSGVKTQNGDPDWGTTSWKEADGAPMLLSWTVDIPGTDLPRITPLAYGDVGDVPGPGYTYQLNAGSNFTDPEGNLANIWSRPDASGLTAARSKGLAWLMCQTVYDNIIWQTSSSWTGSSWSYGWKSNAFFDYRALIGVQDSGTNRYRAWINNFGKDSRYTWWYRAEMPGGTAANTVYAVYKYLWKPETTSTFGAKNVYDQLNGRIFFTTDLAVTEGGISTDVGNAGTIVGANYRIVLDALRTLAPNHTTLLNGTNATLPTYKYTGDGSIADSYGNMPLGLWFMNIIPDRAVKMDDTGNNPTMAGITNDPLTQHKYHVRQMISLLIGRSTRLSASYK